MAIMLLITGFSFLAPEGTGRLAGVATGQYILSLSLLDSRWTGKTTANILPGIYMFMVVYSPGEGPVPFTYSAEAFVSTWPSIRRIEG